MTNNFLPVCKQDMIEREWEQADFVYVIGDAYVDHPSFGHAIISRVLEARGYKVAMIPQPDWKNKDSIQVFGKPRLGFLIAAGNMDSMVNHYSVSKRRRNKDAFTPGGEMGKRPDRATIVYGNLIRQTYKDVPIIIGGVEASLRRLAHYDYWDNKVRRSILLDSGADLLIYGMGEHAIMELADALDSGLDIKDITFINGTVYKSQDTDSVYEGIRLPDFTEIVNDKRTYAESFNQQFNNTDAITAKPLIEKYREKEYVIQNPPAKPLNQDEMDWVYQLPFERTWHPMYNDAGGIDALQEIKFSLTSNRGCFGGCNFCALTFHQGRHVQTRSHESIIAEAKIMTEDPDFKGYIHDVGGPTANFRHPSCEKQKEHGVCRNRQCLFPSPCKNLKVDHKDYLSLLRKLRELPKVKKVFIRSGIRFDYVMADKDDSFLRELCQYHISGQLRVAPEHITNRVLSKMGKPENSVYEQFKKRYERVNGKVGKEQYLVPYLMSSHPGSTLKDAIALAEYSRDLGYMPEQVQDFYPTPGTISTCMYYTGLDPITMEQVYVPNNPKEKAMQRALIQYRDPRNYDLVLEALRKEKRMDLVGFGSKCLIPPRKMEHIKQGRSNKDNSKKKKRIRNVHKKR